MVFPEMRQVVKPSKNPEENPEPEKWKKEVKGYEMIIGRSQDSKEARNRWIDEVEKILEDEGFERGQKHLTTNFEHASIHNDNYYSRP